MLRDERPDRSVLRDEYLAVNDKLIYEAVRNYLTACDEVFWQPSSNGSYIRKTVGIQALLDVMRDLVKIGKASGDLRKEFFHSRLVAAASIDFSDVRFRNPSGSGRSFIRKLLLAKMGLSANNDFDQQDREKFGL